MSGSEAPKYEEIRAHLGMKHSLVGVKFIQEGDPRIESLKSKRPGGRKWYCQMVREAACGTHIAAFLDDMACPNAELALGMRKPKYTSMPAMIKETIAALEIGPLEGADVILFLLNPRQVMHLSLLLGGISAEFRGETAVCGEATAMVYAQKIPNLSLLCNGARMYGGYTDNEMVMGVPPFLVDKVAEKVSKQRKCGGALCGCMISDLPRDVIAAFKSIGFEKSTDYFMGKIGKYSVRIYINKDDCGALKELTLYLPLKLKGVAPEVSPPFMTRARDGWLDIYTVIDAQSEGIDIYAGGESMLRTFTNLIADSIRDRGEDDQ